MSAIGDGTQLEGADAEGGASRATAALRAEHPISHPISPPMGHKLLFSSPDALPLACFQPRQGQFICAAQMLRNEGKRMKQERRG